MSEPIASPPRPGIDPAPPRGYLPALDGLRGIAILVVILHNTTGLEATPGLAAKLWTFVVDAGWVGVQLFFVLSGFLITGILLDGRGKPRALRNFYVRRSLRIFPLYYLFLIGRFFVVPLFVAGTSVPASYQVGYWLYLANWTGLAGLAVYGMAHFWSLAVEEQFYLVWPAVATKLARRTFAWVCVAIAVGALAVRVGMRVAGVADYWMYQATFARADGLALGALVAIMLRSEPGLASYRRYRGAIAIAALVGLAGVMAYAHGLSRYEWVVQTAGYSVLGVLFAVVVAECATPVPTGWRAALAAPPLRAVGRYSYAMYVLHLPAKVVILDLLGDWYPQQVAAHPLAADVAFTCAMCAVSFLLALVSYAIVERPFLALKDRWAS